MADMGELWDEEGKADKTVNDKEMNGNHPVHRVIVFCTLANTGFGLALSSCLCYFMIEYRKIQIMKSRSRGRKQQEKRNVR